MGCAETEPKSMMVESAEAEWSARSGMSMVSVVGSWPVEAKAVAAWGAR